MYLNEIEIEKIAKFITAQIVKSGHKVVDEGKARLIITNIIHKNIADEKLLEEDALALMKKFGGADTASLDHDKALRMIKVKLAKERKFAL